ncbi:hypothetical protein Aeqsu_2488 [Aequorivita sublithincola DSM 14238]|uniref:Secretion system C-terminal sorting domain-containing protein n=1 Tax=Aequorivita sublithincola (strain DSM 14238 / LMG 21431 / ACAM 643 / 9-3) TaxID=746697 RepID=I3YY77_AEQSU|nr:T9SS type A sorting domain-containing protein [Aequorivita sublithincola]AFL81945.1 hypothetical protein Aeqsu_2488 [Aequorivita sublithincola DSM 14238]
MKLFLLFFTFLTISHSVYAQIIVNENPTPLAVCDNNNDGFEQFTLHDKDEEIQNGNPSVSVTYHRTLLDAENAENEIVDPYINDIAYNDVVYVRAENFAVFDMDLQVRSSPIANTPAPLRKCDDAVADGFTFFDLTVAATEVLGSLNPLGFDLYYYEILADATTAGDLAITNPDFSQAVSNPQSYFNIQAYAQDIYILLVSNANGTIPPNPNSAEGCYDIVSLPIIVNLTPPDYGPFGMMLCDDELNGSSPTDGISTFDLTVNNLVITGGDPTLIVTWYQTLADEQNEIPILNPESYQNIATPQTVIGRVENAFGCKTLVTLTLSVLPNPSPNTNPTPLIVCDDNYDGIYGSWDLTLRDTEILNGELDVSIYYYVSEAEAQAGVPGTEITMPYTNTVPFNQVVYARVTNNVPPALLGCYTLVQLELIVKERPPITQPNNLFIDEGDGDGFAIFDLTVNIPVMLAGLNPSDYEVYFFENLADANNGINPIVNSTTDANTINPQTIYVRIDTLNTGCFEIASFLILTDETAPDADGDGIANEDEDINGNGNLNDDDTDGDGIPNYLDNDDDGDTVLTIDETTGIGAGVAPSYIYIDTDGDNVENYLDSDDDGDGTLTKDEDYNNNGTPIDDDTNGNSIPDFLDDEVFIGVNSFNFKDLSISPNPTSESFTIQSSQLILETTISLYDIQGKILFSEKMLPQNGKLTINVSSLENGVYFVKISSEGNVAVRKIIKN